MKIEINHMDTFLLVKGILNLVHDTFSAECYEGVEDLLKQMEKVPETDDSGYFKEEDPRVTAVKKLEESSGFFMDSMKEFLDKDPDVKQAYKALKSNIGEAMGPVTYAAWKLRQAIKVSQYRKFFGTEWIDNFLAWYEDSVFVRIMED